MSENDFPQPQWVRVEFYGALPSGQVMTGLDPLETADTLMRSFGFTYIDGLSAAVAEGRRRVVPLSAPPVKAGEVARLRQALWDIYAACGEDTDGDTEAPAPGVWTPDIDSLALAAVRSLRQERDEATRGNR